MLTEKRRLHFRCLKQGDASFFEALWYYFKDNTYFYYLKALHNYMKKETLSALPTQLISGKAVHK